MWLGSVHFREFQSLQNEIFIICWYASGLPTSRSLGPLALYWLGTSLSYQPGYEHTLVLTSKTLASVKSAWHGVTVEVFELPSVAGKFMKIVFSKFHDVVYKFTKFIQQSNHAWKNVWVQMQNLACDSYHTAACMFYFVVLVEKSLLVAGHRVHQELKRSMCMLLVSELNLLQSNIYRNYAV